MGLVGIIAFSNLTYYHPEVTKGWIGIFWNNTGEKSNPTFFDIYPSDLLPILDRKHPSQSDALKVVNNIINSRGTRNTFAVSTHSFTQSFSEPIKKPTKSITTDSSSYSNRCDKVVHVKGYTTKKGKYVAPYDRRPPGC